VIVAAGQVDLAVDIQGDGPSVLFVHGFPFDRTMWRHQMGALSGWRRIAPDLRGVGGSTAPAAVDRYSLGGYADDLVAVLDALGVREVAVCGLSLGGYIVFELLRRHPERVRAVILANTQPGADSTEARRGRDELATVAVREGPDAVIGRLLARLLAPTTLTTQPGVVAQVREMARRWSVPGIVGALRAMRDRPDSRETLRRVSVPTLVLAGSDDPIAPPAVAEAMARLVQGEEPGVRARFHVVAGAAHLAPLEQPLVTTRLVADFLGAIG
jgi:pimeloyl-ACP methyl ester carboxylesterase